MTDLELWLKVSEFFDSWIDGIEPTIEDCQQMDLICNTLKEKALKDKNVK